ncbi:MAG TPA: YihY/virulence factor BrkB family protein [Actinomycetota bacterium]|jgi:membrane protein|nr:YihY/virulence factor BrkB family protein [Actinomycetota bacterium]
MSRAIELGRALWRDARQDRVNGLAAEVAFFAVLSVFPALLVLADALGSLEALVGGEFARDAQQVVLDFLRGILTERAGATVDAVEDLFARESAGVATLATLVAVVSLSRAFAAVIRALDLAYDVDERRSWLHLRLLAVGASVATVILSAVTLAAIVLGPLLGEGGKLAEAVGLGEVWTLFWSWFRWPVALILMVAWATTLYRIVPAQNRRWRDGLPGAAFAAGGWILASLGLRAYLALASGSNPVFGVLGGGLILLLWLYLLSLALLLGAELNGVLARGGRGRDREEPAV